MARVALLAFLAIAVVPALVACTSSTPTLTSTPMSPPTPSTTPTPLPTTTPTLTLQDQLLHELVAARATATALMSAPTPTATPPFYAPPISFLFRVPPGGGDIEGVPSSEFTRFQGWEVLEAAEAAAQGEHSGRVESEFILDLGEVDGVKTVLAESTTGVWKTPDSLHLSITVSRQGSPSVEIDGRTIETPITASREKSYSLERMYTS